MATEVQAPIPDDTKFAEETVQMYQDMFKDRYTERDETYMATVNKADPPPPCVRNWFTKPRRNFDRGGYRGGGDRRGGGGYHHGNRDYRDQGDRRGGGGGYHHGNRDYRDQGDRRGGGGGYHHGNRDYRDQGDRRGGGGGYHHGDRGHRGRLW